MTSDAQFLNHLRCVSCGQKAQLCSVLTRFLRKDGNYAVEGQCHSCADMMVAACKTAGFEVSGDRNLDACTCLLSPYYATKEYN